MKSPSLVFRLALLQQGLAAGLILVFSGSAIWLTSRTLERQEGIFLSSIASRMAESLIHEWDEESDLSLAAMAALEEGDTAGVRIDVYDADGNRVASSASSAQIPPRGEVRETRIHLERGATVVASTSTRPRRDAIAALSLALLLTAVPLWIAVAALSRALAGRALRPLSRMAAQAELAATPGAMDALGRPGDPAEIATLADAFNRLLARLDETFRAEQHFTQDAAHELRTPLTVLSGEIEYALTEPALPPRIREGLEHASRQARAMGELVEALLFLRRADVVSADQRDLAPVNLSDLVREIARELLAGEAGRERERDVEVSAEDEVLVTGHSTLLASALRNLLSNALKFTRAGEPVKVVVRSSGGECAVTVDDGGRGIAPADRERVFDPFFRGAEARASDEGFGLGLAILRRVARAHGGEVEVSASPLGGARFELRLPCWTPRA